MRNISIWLLVLGMFAGLQGRALGADPCEVLAAMHMHHHGDHHHHDEDHRPDAPCGNSHDEKCPLDHHHGHCCHVMPMAAEFQHPSSFVGFGFSLSPIRSEVELAPEGPYLSEDKPPLI